MLWNSIDKQKFMLYINRDIDLKIKVYEKNDKDEVYMNYKGFNLTIPMLVWEFGEDLSLASIEDVSIEGESTLINILLLTRMTKTNFWMKYIFF